MIGWYAHHQGSGHVQRARAVRAELGVPMTVLSSMPRPADWDGPWIRLRRDDGPPASSPSAGGRLHWAPLHHPGLRTRMATISAWIDSSAPELIVCDVSVEVALMARLHGIPVLYVAMPGDRSDDPHRLAYDIASALVGCWPPQAHGMLRRPRGTRGSAIRLVGGLSRFPVQPSRPRRPGPRRATLLWGTGDGGISRDWIDLARASSPGWEWTVLGGASGTWRDDPFQALCDADVVVTHAGENALAEVAAARRPAVVVPSRRPYDEQYTTGRVLMRREWPAEVRWEWPTSGWSALLEQTAGLDGSAWAPWCDGQAAARFARIITETIGQTGEVA
jgi:hypothetical protein